MTVGPGERTLGEKIRQCALAPALADGALLAAGKLEREAAWKSIA
jgi:hypothetical protein